MSAVPSPPEERRPATQAELRLLLDLTSAKGRREQARCLVEGPVLLAEALSSGSVPELILVDQDLAARDMAVVEQAERAGAQVALLTGKQAHKLSDREHAPGLLAALDLPDAFEWGTAMPCSADAALVVLLCGLQDPGNVGTLVRSARAFGATALLHLAGGADPLGPKALRASAGAALRLPMARTTLDEALERAAEFGLTPACAVAPARRSADPGPAPVRAPSRCLLLLGHETKGVPPVSAALSLAVAQEADVESLNVSMAGSILMADWYRTQGPGARP